MSSNALSSTPSSSTPTEKSLQRLRPRQHDAPACHARRSTGTNCSSSPSRRTRKCADSCRVAMSRKYGCAAGSSRLVKRRSIASPPYCPGGKLIECRTRSVIAAPGGRSSQFGEAIYRASGSRPSGPIFIADAEALHPVAQLPEGDAEKLGSRRTVEPGFRQRIEDRLALQAVEVVGQRFPRAALGALLRHRLRRREPQVLAADLLACAQSERPLQNVLELADVAGEAVAHELVGRRGRDLRRGGAGLGRQALQDRGGDERDVLAAFA